MPQTAQHVQQQIDELGPWFHNLHLPDGSQTAPDHRLGDFPAVKWRQIAPHIPEDLTDLTVLDIGCNAGFYAIELARRGAQVLAIDHDPRYLEQAQWAAAQFDFGHRISFSQMEVYDLPALGDRTFDIIWFMGVFYHLRYPLLGLDLVRQHVGQLLVFQSLTMPGGEDHSLQVPINCDINDRQRMLDAAYPKMAFIEHRLADDPTNWWAPNAPCVDAMLRSCGLRVVARPAHEVVVCELTKTRETNPHGLDRAARSARQLSVPEPGAKELDESQMPTTT